MAQRSYGIPVGYRPAPPASPTTSPSRRPASPSNRYNYSSQTHHFAPPAAPHNTSPPARSNPPLSNFSAPQHPRQPHPSQTYQNHMAVPGGSYYGSSDGMADHYPRDSQALRDIDNLFGGPRITSPPPESRSRHAFGQQAPSYHAFVEPSNSYTGATARAPVPQTRRVGHQTSTSQSSLTPLMANPAALGGDTPSPPPRAMGRTTERGTPRGISQSPPKMAPYGVAAEASPYSARPARIPRAASYYQGDGYDVDFFNPADIADDGDDSLDPSPRPNWRQSRLPSSAALLGGSGALGAAGATTAGNNATSLGSSNPADDRDMSRFYDHMSGGNEGRGTGENTASNNDPEKSQWLQDQNSSSKRLRWIIGVIIGIIGIAAIAGGIAGGILAKKGSSSPGSTSHSSGKLYDINSDEVKKILNNKDLHRVFPGMDYTPLNAQYPDCLTNPPDQNNITLDVALLAQLSPSIRLYGTDCDQTEMLLTAIDRLGYNDTVKVWLGVWLDKNTTTSTRQIEKMYHILDTYPSSHFAGIIVGNEVLFRKDLTEAELANQLQGVRNNLTSKGIHLPVATSDLGDDWTSALAADSDIVMANIHPFFAGTTAEQSAGWSWTFWQGHDVNLAPATGTGSYPKHIISEIGWPSEGGNDCGTTTACPDDKSGAVASVDNMNTFMGEWVCQSIKNGTTYFWFEAFDEPWKVRFNTDTDKWESKWGLFDSDRNLKPNLKIPDCGQTLDKPY